MTLLPVFLLPVLALAMIVFLPLFQSDDMRSTSFRSRRYRKTLLGRLAVAVLLLATLITVIWPIEGMNSLVQGILLVLAVMVPAYILSWVIARMLRNKPKETAESVESETLTVPPETVPAVKQSIPRTRRTRKTSLNDTTDTLSLHQRVAPQRSEGSDALLADTGWDSKDPSARGSAGNSFREDSPAEVQEQLDRVADLVQTHDLGESRFAENNEEDSWESIRNTHDRQSALSSQMMMTDGAGTDLASMSTSEMTDMVVDLRRTKTRLQKLVIAQQSAIDSERKAHDQSRLVARDAIKIMRDSRQAQKFAEKLARRERTERQRIEMQYKEVTGALDNALSIIAKRKLQGQSGAPSSSSEKHLRDSDRLDDILV